jgi:Protein of unknown function (DUF3575).
MFVNSLGFKRKLNRYKTGFLSFVIVLLCLIFHSSLQAQNRVNSRDFSMDKKYVSRDTMFLRNSIVAINTFNQTQRKPVYIALKNNLLYDVVLLPNLAVEVYLGGKWSLAVNGNLSWWKFNEPVQNEWFHRIQTVGAELRYWFDSPFPLHGHAIGLYGMTGNYDLRLFPGNENSNGWLSNRSWSTGLSYAYSVPISCYFNMEFGISFGYVGGKYYKYNYCLDDEWWAQQQEKNRHYFGPTKAGISLVWLIGSGNSRKKREVYFIR